MKDSIITSFSFSQEAVGEIKTHQFGKDWPVVYILKNKELAYIGETSAFVNRIRQHLANPRREPFSDALVIADLDFNKSATLDIESWLIDYMAADGTLGLQNLNGGVGNHSYFDREKYRAKFEQIWGDLMERKIANKTYDEIKNSDIFKYSPYKALTEEQSEVLHGIFQSINSGYTGARIVSGEPGTGKSILAISLIKQLVQDQRTRHINVGLVVPMTSLRKTLQRVFSKVQGLKSSMVLGPHDIVGKHYDVLIVDETHRLHRRINITNYKMHDDKNKHLGLAPDSTELDWIRASSRSQVLFYDAKQSVRPSDIRPEDVAELGAEYYSLTNQLRVAGGDGYIEYIDHLVSGDIQELQTFKNYDFKYFDSFDELRRSIKAHHQRYGLSCLVAGFAWDWVTKKDRTRGYDFEIEGTQLKWNGTAVDWINSPNMVNEIGCIHTVQGYDLNNVGVIFGPEVYYDETRKCLRVDKDKYRDINGKKGVESQEELDTYVRNIYKTLLTRGIKGTYVYAVNDSVKQYLKTWVI